MLYQPVLNGAVHYTILKRHLHLFPLHIHHEVELIFCQSGKISVEVGGVSLDISENELIVIGSMVPHRICCDGENLAVVIEMGRFFLHGYFSRFAAIGNDMKKIALASSPCGEEKELFSSLCEISTLCESKDIPSEMKTVGCLYRIAGCISALNTEQKSAADKKSAPALEKALDLVYCRFRDPITVDDAAKITGYGKSNFCRIFKKTVGMSFHSYLNLYRIRNSECLLSATDRSMDEISEMTGFSDRKSFCRVFREINGMTPSEYRKKNS